MAKSEVWLDLKLLIQRLGFMLGLLIVVLFNLLILPIHVFYRLVLKKNIWPVVWPKPLKERVDMYSKYYKKDMEKFLYKQTEYVEDNEEVEELNKKN